jgi:hypothetical protein
MRNSLWIYRCRRGMCCSTCACRSLSRGAVRGSAGSKGGRDSWDLWVALACSTSGRRRGGRRGTVIKHVSLVALSIGEEYTYMPCSDKILKVSECEEQDEELEKTIVRRNLKTDKIHLEFRTKTRYNSCLCHHENPSLYVQHARRTRRDLQMVDTSNISSCRQQKKVRTRSGTNQVRIENVPR